MRAPLLVDLYSTTKSLGNEASWREPTGCERARFLPSRGFIGNGGQRAGAARAAAGGAGRFRGRANWWNTTPPRIETYGGPVKLWVGGLYGTDLRSENLAVFASAVLIISC